MDPNACLLRIASLFAQKTDPMELDFACHELFEWIDGGGFEPDWTAHELATSYYRTLEEGFRLGCGIAIR